MSIDLTVADVMLPPDEAPVVEPKMFLKNSLEVMSDKSLGIACIVEPEGGALAGIMTDGDIRRMVLKDQKPFSALMADDVIDHATTAPTTVTPDTPLKDALELMERKRVWDIPVVEESGTFAGLLHLHPAIKAVLGLDT